MEQQLKLFLNSLQTEFKISESKLLESLNRILYKNDNKKSIAKIKVCQMQIKYGKNKGSICGAKTTGEFCGRHSKKENDTVSKKEESFETTRIFKKNKFGYFTVDKTGLVFKNANERFIIGKQSEEDGSINPLTQEDIDMCKRLRLRHKSVTEIMWPSIDPNKEAAANKEAATMDTTEYTSKISLL